MTIKLHRIVFAFLLLTIASCSKSGNSTDNGGDNGGDEEFDWNAAAKQATDNQISNFWNYTKYWFKDYPTQDTWSYGYWPQAHALELSLDAYERSATGLQNSVINNWVVGVKAANNNSWRNEFYDDMAWNAIATLRAYDITNDDRYKEAALAFWDYLLPGWSDVCGGGISWKSSSDYVNSKNACSTCPTGIFAARMYTKFGDSKYLKLAQDCYDWMRNTLFDTSTGAVSDNISLDSSEKENISTAVYSYNEGTFLGLCLELYKINNESVYLRDAIKATDYTISNLASGSILKGTDGHGDGALFDGIFIRYFTQLIMCKDLTQNEKARYIAILKKNAVAAWNEGRSDDNFFSGRWTEKPSGTNYDNNNICGCTLIEQVAMLQRKGYI